MNNIPVFMAQGGTASLILREIPFSGNAYVLLRTVLPENLELMLGECAEFCRNQGAKRVFVSRERETLPLTHAYDILRMTISKEKLPPAPNVNLVPLQAGNEKEYVQIYNRCFLHVSHAGSYDKRQIQRIYAQNQQAFLAEENGNYYGIGELHENELAAVGVLPQFRGKGTALTLNLLSLCPGSELHLTVASDNEKALRMYEKLGFGIAETESIWYVL